MPRAKKADTKDSLSAWKAQDLAQVNTDFFPRGKKTFLSLNNSQILSFFVVTS